MRESQEVHNNVSSIQTVCPPLVDEKWVDSADTIVGRSSFSNLKLTFRFARLHSASIGWRAAGVRRSAADSTLATRRTDPTGRTAAGMHECGRAGDFAIARSRASFAEIRRVILYWRVQKTRFSLLRHMQVLVFWRLVLLCVSLSLAEDGPGVLIRPQLPSVHDVNAQLPFSYHFPRLLLAGGAGAPTAPEDANDRHPAPPRQLVGVCSSALRLVSLFFCSACAISVGFASFFSFLLEPQRARHFYVPLLRHWG